MRNPRSHPGLVQLAIAIVLTAALWALAAALGLPDGWARLVGIVLGSLLLYLWEASARSSAND